MPIVDRAIMRIAVFEMVYRNDVPVSVTINECVELAKQFGGDDESGGFVNGVLGGIARKLDDPDFILPSELSVDDLVAQGVLGSSASPSEDDVPAADAPAPAPAEGAAGAAAPAKEDASAKAEL
jgi:N utilization substance protein B